MRLAAFLYKKDKMTRQTVIFRKSRHRDNQRQQINQLEKVRKDMSAGQKLKKSSPKMVILVIMTTEKQQILVIANTNQEISSNS